MFLDWAQLERGPSVNTWMCNLQLHAVRSSGVLPELIVLTGCRPYICQVAFVNLGWHSFIALVTLVIWIRLHAAFGSLTEISEPPPPPKECTYLFSITHCYCAWVCSSSCRRWDSRCLVYTWRWVRRQYVAYGCYNVCRMSGGGCRPWGKCSSLAPKCNLCK